MLCVSRATFHEVAFCEGRARGNFRAYRIALVRDLFGTWLVEMTFGRIGTDGRTRAYPFEGEKPARAFMARCLRCRHSAPRRIGVPYAERWSYSGDGKPR